MPDRQGIAIQRNAQQSRANWPTADTNMLWELFAHSKCSKSGKPFTIIVELPRSPGLAGQSFGAYTPD